MRLCRYLSDEAAAIGFYTEDRVIPLDDAARAAGLRLPAGDSLLPLLPGGEVRATVVDLERRLESGEITVPGVPAAGVSLLVPVANPAKLLLLAGNYSAHIEEGGGRAEERARTFPYVFMKPPSTTLTHPGRAVRIPAVSPDHIDWELELGVIIGRRCRGVSEADALGCVAGYTVVNDISDRKFRPNPGRAKREKDGFFDWLHGKWHDTFCPMGPCVLPADELPDPQSLRMMLRVNGQVEQDASTADMVFPVAAVIAFLSSFVTLEPGDVISTGTPSGVGFAKGKFLKAGDVLEAEIERIGVLRNPVEA
ncbi:MAG TPA: fumarylacetoacetate hydrolase family protein [Planctomycetaceae bacterium]|nr:fumarylacetoacetate hydrolase family protein [Planctomycetaceae bacterium]